MAKARVERTGRKNLNRASGRRDTLLKKLADPADKDDPRWLKRRLAAVDAFIAKKEKAKARKEREKQVGQARVSSRKES